MPSLSHEFTISKKDTPLITKDGDFEMIVELFGGATCHFESETRHEPSSYCCDVNVSVEIDENDLITLCSECECTDIEAMRKYIMSIDFSEDDDVREYFIGLEN